MNYDMRNRLRTLRQYYNLSQKELADILGMSESGYQLWEGGMRDGKPVNPRLNNLIALSQVFGISINDLLGLEVQPVNPPYGGVFFDNGWWWYKLHRKGHLSQDKHGPFLSRQVALNALIVKLNAISECEKDVHPGRGEGDGGSGPGQCGPSDSDMGERLQRNEVAVPGRAETLPGCGKGVLP